jgi:hypothetical protein
MGLKNLKGKLKGLVRSNLKLRFIYFYCRILFCYFFEMKKWKDFIKMKYIVNFKNLI